MPPVALTSAMANAPLTAAAAVSRPLPATEPTDTPRESGYAEPASPSRLAGRPHLRLVPAGPEPGMVIHGRGGPASCSCRACTMARHPAAMPRLTVVR